MGNNEGYARYFCAGIRRRTRIRDKAARDVRNELEIIGPPFVFRTSTGEKTRIIVPCRGPRESLCRGTFDIPFNNLLSLYSFNIRKLERSMAVTNKQCLWGT